MMELGDLVLLGRPEPRLVKAIAVIAAELHKQFAADPSLKPEISRRSCILCSLAIRDFLRKVGFADASCQACAITVRGFEGEREFHSAGAVPFATGNGYPGHVVCVVGDFLIDATLYQLQREVWPELPGMIAAPRDPFPALPLGADFTECCEHEDQRRIEISWYPLATRSWKAAPDARRDYRAKVVKALVKQMEGFRG